MWMMKKLVGAVVMAAIMALAAGVAQVTQAARVTVEYGIEASLRMVP